MKSRLIQRYYQLASESREVGWLAVLMDMHRIQAILWERYKYDISLTRKLN